MAEVVEERTLRSTRAPSRSSQVEEKQFKEKLELETSLHGTKTDDPEAQQVVQAPKPDFPEGGLWGWATVAGAYVHSFVSLVLELAAYISVLCRFCVQFCGFGCVKYVIVKSRD